MRRLALASVSVLAIIASLAIVVHTLTTTDRQQCFRTLAESGSAVREGWLYDANQPLCVHQPLVRIP